MKLLVCFLLGLALYVTANANENPGAKIENIMKREVRTPSEKHLIVISFPGTDQEYYTTPVNYHPAIAKYIKDMEAAVGDYDEIAILYDDSAWIKDDDGNYLYDFDNSPSYTCNVGGNDWIGVDLWTRDFAPVIANLNVQFKYEPGYLGKEDIELSVKGMEDFYKWIGESPSITSDIILDGGNVVENGVENGVAIITRRVVKENFKFYTDNDDRTSCNCGSISEAACDKCLQDIAEPFIRQDIEAKIKRKVVFIDDFPGDTTGHADGMVSFINENTLLVGECDVDDVRAAIVARLGANHGITIDTLPCVGDFRRKRQAGFSSAIGWYANSLVTHGSVYASGFNKEPDDSNAFQKYRDLSGKPNVKQIDTSKISDLGGSVRCMTWNTVSSTKLAQAIKKACSGSTKPHQSLLIIPFLIFTMTFM